MAERLYLLCIELPNQQQIGEQLYAATPKKAIQKFFATKGIRVKSITERKHAPSHLLNPNQAYIAVSDTNSTPASVSESDRKQAYVFAYLLGGTRENRTFYKVETDSILC